LLRQTVSDMNNLVFFRPCIDYKKVAGIFLGDPDRIRYILSSLLRNAIDRNHEFQELHLVKVSAEITDNTHVDLAKQEEQSSYERRSLVIVVTD